MSLNKAAAFTVNNELNKPTNKFGIDFRLLLGCLVVSAAAFFAISNLFGLALAFALPMTIRFIVRKDPQIFKLVSLSFLHRAYYDPAKKGAKK